MVLTRVVACISTPILLKVTLTCLLWDVTVLVTSHSVRYKRKGLITVDITVSVVYVIQAACCRTVDNYRYYAWRMAHDSFKVSENMT